MSSGIQRKRLACIECTRRKIKCDKTVPCRNCTRKGTICSRSRTRESPSSPHSTRFEDQFETVQPGQSKPKESALIQELQSKIEHLENALKRANEAANVKPSQIPKPPSEPNIIPHSPVESFAGQEASVCEPDLNDTRSVKAPREVEDAATILEFLAWGRRKDPSYQDEIAKGNDLVHSPGDLPMDDDWNGSNNSRPSMISLCELLLPTRSKVNQLVKYHCECLLWYHGAFHATTFVEELENFYDHFGNRSEMSGADLQWMSLLFAILTGSMASAPAAITQAWGFRDQEKRMLSHRWLKASVDCLHQAEYMACHSIYAVESIATLTISAHMLGKSNSFSVLLASAVRIAQGLGLHQLDGDNDVKSWDPISREIGRRIWCQLCIQDWFSIPFTESYLINRQCFNTEKPSNCNDSLVPISDDLPTIASYSRLFYDIAALMPALYDDLNSSNTLYTRYEEVLKYDRYLRDLATQKLPRYLQNIQLDPSWPPYVLWARRSLAISSAHKVIMIHRKFLSMSFVNPMFEFTRKTCVAASRTIIKEQKEATCDSGPLLWIHQAFSVTASIILCLDMFHRPAKDNQSMQNRQFVEDGIEILSRYDSDMIARRGVSLLKTMLHAEEKRWQTPNSPDAPLFQKTGMGLNIANIIQTFYKQDQHGGTSKHANCAPHAESNMRGDVSDDWPRPVSPDSSTMLPNNDLFMPFGVDYTAGLDDILSLATNYPN